MRVRLISDTHFEFHKDHGRSFVDSLDPSGCDVLVLAGDISNGPGIANALTMICNRFDQVPVVRLFDGEARPDELGDLTHGMIIGNIGGARLIVGKRARILPCTSPFWAMGSGGDFAIGSMAAGKNAIEAVHIAAQYDTFTGGGVDWVTLPEMVVCGTD